MTLRFATRPPGRQRFSSTFALPIGPYRAAPLLATPVLLNAHLQPNWFAAGFYGCLFAAVRTGPRACSGRPPDYYRGCHAPALGPRHMVRAFLHGLVLASNACLRLHGSLCLRILLHAHAYSAAHGLLFAWVASGSCMDWSVILQSHRITDVIGLWRIPLPSARRTALLPMPVPVPGFWIITRWLPTRFPYGHAVTVLCAKFVRPSFSRTAISTAYAVTVRWFVYRSRQYNVVRRAGCGWLPRTRP